MLAGVVGLALAGWTTTSPVLAQDGTPPGAPGQAGKEKPDFPPFKEVVEGYEQVVSTTDGQAPLYTLWKREKDGQLLAELPRGWQNQKHMFSMTVPTGELFAGLQTGDIYAYWKRFDKRLALIEPQIDVRATGDPEVKDAITHHFTDRVLLDVPILCMGPNGQPVIDLDNLLIGNSSVFYGRLGAGANAHLATIKEVKAFPKNIVVAIEIPVAGGQLKTFHYDIAVIPDNTGYQPRKADERIGYFTTSYRDLGKVKQDEVWTRYINRWDLQKRDPKLKMSPPKEPITFYIECTVPPKYRRWIKEGILYWNKAFEKVGLVDAIEVQYQDKETGANMDKDPEDSRYNFIRWLSNDIGTAVGPHRSHPITGQILDADIVLTDGWIRHFWYQSNEFLPQAAMEGMAPETLAWLDQHPNWDPRVRLAPPELRDQILANRARRGVVAYGGIPAPLAALMDNPQYQKNLDAMTPANSLCMAANGKSVDMALMGLNLEVLGLLDQAGPDGKKDEAKKDDTKKDDKKDDAKKDEKKDDSDKIDGIPEWFLGPALADLTCHEVGHTLGLRHNFRASSIYSLAKINSKELKGAKPLAGSVMDYIPVNINMDDGEVQGDYFMIGVGPYDQWAIEYGYTFDDPAKVLKRCGEPELTYATDEDTGGCDPLARRYDFAADPRDYAISRNKLAKFLRGKLLDKFVKDGESWSKARRGYQITMSTQVDAINIMSTWLGGAFVNRDHKGDPGDRSPIAPVPAAQQRAALKFVIDNAFSDESWGLTPELLQKMTVEKWEDGGNGNPGAEPTWPIHDRIAGIQAAALTMLMNPTTLRRVYDNELLVPTDQDALTLPEMLDTISTSIWSELDKGPSKTATNREPMISSLRRNLQREHVERLIDLSLGDGSGASGKTIATLATAKLRDIQDKIGKSLEKGGARLDGYTTAHLSECKLRIGKALEAQYIYNAGGSGGFGGGFFFGQTTAQPAPSPKGEGEQK
jgi:hypothetical protein